jgi:uncharacterized protein (DUF1501 family)
VAAVTDEQPVDDPTGAPLDAAPGGPGDDLDDLGDLLGDQPADPARLGPDVVEGTLRLRAAQVAAERRRRDDLWRRGFTRRRFLTGVGGAAVAGLGAQLATARASFGVAPGTGTLVVVFLRGGMDGLSVLVPADDPHLPAARPNIGVPAGALLPLARGFGLHPALRPLHDLWNVGALTAVPAVSTPDVSRSHFQAQDCLERGGSGTGTNEGWLDRVLDALGPGTTFRAVGSGATVPRALAGDQRALAVDRLERFRLAGWDKVHPQTVEAVRALYTGLDHPIAQDVATTLEALDIARLVVAADLQPAATYPEGELATRLAEVAQLVKADVGLRVACLDVGGWDMHTGLGTVEAGAMTRHLTMLGEALRAFADDLGDRLADVTVVAMTEFGRRVQQNANAGTDHGHGAVVLLMGGGLAGGTVPGAWHGLAPEGLDRGDVPGWNDYRDVLGEVVTHRLGVGAAGLATVFPGHRVQPLGVMA